MNSIEYALRDHFGYARALAGFEIANIILLTIVVSLGPESKGKEFLVEVRDRVSP